MNSRVTTAPATPLRFEAVAKLKFAANEDHNATAHRAAEDGGVQKVHHLGSKLTQPPQMNSAPKRLKYLRKELIYCMVSKNQI